MAEVYKPHVYQQRAQNFLEEHPAAALFLDMGLGKTVVTLTHIEELLYDYCLGYKVLVIAPARVAESTWSEELSKWKHLKGLRLVRIGGAEPQRIRSLLQDADVYTISRDNTAWLVRYCRFQKHWPFQVVVIDESSGFKSHKAQRFRALKQVRPHIKRIIELTGTPAPNGLLDLWSQIYLLDQGERLGKSFSAYRDKYFLPDRRDALRIFSWKPKPGAEEDIYVRIGDITTSMKAEDYLQLPELVENVLRVELDPAEMKRYKNFEKEWLLELDGETITAPTAAALAGKLLQLSNGAIYDEAHDFKVLHNKKIDALRDIVEANEGKSVLVFYSYRHDLERLKAAFPEAVEYRGDVEYKAWNEGCIGIMLCHPASVGYGLNLQAGGHIIAWFGITWSLEQYQQAIARLYRQGQRHTVIIHYLISAGCYDEKVLPALQRKELNQERLLEAVKMQVLENREVRNERFLQVSLLRSKVRL